MGDNLSPFFPSQAQARITLTTTNKQTNKQKKKNREAFLRLEKDHDGAHQQRPHFFKNVHIVHSMYDVRIYIVKCTVVIFQ